MEGRKKMDLFKSSSNVRNVIFPKPISRIYQIVTGIILLLFFPMYTAGIEILPGKLSSFEVTAPKEVTAGTPFSVIIKARDKFENLVINYSKEEKGIILNTEEGISIQPYSILSSSFESGIAKINITCKKSGEITIFVKDMETICLGKSQKIKVFPGKLDRFSVEIPQKALAGEEFPVIIKSLDSYNNLCTNYSQLYSPIKVKIENNWKKVEEPFFKNGIAIVSLNYNKKGIYSVKVLNENGDEKGESEKITILPNKIDHFIVETPEKANAGKPFLTLIKAVDKYENIIENYDKCGKDIKLISTGTGNISPRIIPPYSFKNGIAKSELIYDRAENFGIIAEEISGEKNGGNDHREVIQSAYLELKKEIEKLITVKEREPAGEKIEHSIKSREFLDNTLEFIKKRDYEKAMDELKKYISLVPEDTDAQQLKERLSEILKILKEH